ncbi:Xanthine dehydrogenase [Alteripontixanthobacter maritimus]|uniref:Xanthine dehydrogenase n=1 Tax=Alteripontixanthobacter maritimus TaxID=2161824 RepID=A0A369Q8C8_9SPHN|nr:xanthine dehydrogenase family protein molybdopterin-binding subunit [Alteripontixanthobacter maritimus]RDC59179.1 Xanthine dehydrogenase [Alteripontixanthobacter maritimus]
MSDVRVFDEPATDNRLDDMKQGVLGKPLDRPDGPVKVAGAAPYAAEYDLGECVEGVLVTAPFARGQITAIDKASVLDMPGVIAVLDDPRMITRPAQGTAGEAPKQKPGQVDYFGQPIALVVAETFEQARDAAKHLAFEYDADDNSEIPFDPATAETEESDGATRKGDLAKAMSDAAHSVDLIFTTEGHNSAAMEPHAAMAEWDGQKLTVHAALQMLNYNHGELADAVGLPTEQVRILARYVGGGFGSKLGVSPETVAASLAAMELGRTVRVVMSRQQVFQDVVRRSETKQRLRLAAGADGRLIGLGHEARTSNLPGEGSAEPVVQATAYLYPGENRVLAVENATVHRMTAGSVRAPGEAVGMQCLEAAMDELAEAMDIDPIELRLRNIPDEHPGDGKPYSSRRYAECMREGAKAFGWDSGNTSGVWTDGPRKPRQQREGDWWIGTGMAGATRIHLVGRAEARVTLKADGTALVETDMTDIGTGTYAILNQMAGEMLGLPAEKVLVDLGDTDHPYGPGSGGSWGASSSGSAVYQTCDMIRDDIARKVNADAATLEFKDGMVRWPEGEKSLVDIMGGEDIVHQVRFKPGKAFEDYATASYGAFFAEVAVNRWTGETRVRRMTGAFGFGRVLNPKTARSQCIGGMVWCIGSALTEALHFDPVDGHLVNCDLAEYHVPVHRDVPHMDVLLVEERDAHGSPIQAKGAGELGLCGGAGAIANAIYNACGVRMHDFPMTPDRVMAGLEKLES